MTDALIALQAALHELLAADDNLSAMLAGPISDGGPRGAPLPSLSFGEGRTSDWSDGEVSGVRARLTLEAHSRGGGRRDVLAILARAAALFRNGEPALGDSHRAVLITLREGRVERLSDGRTWRGRLVVEALIEPP